MDIVRQNIFFAGYCPAEYFLLDIVQQNIFYFARCCPFLRALKRVANAMQRAEGFMLERAILQAVIGV